ncbi:MAG: SpoIIE family protein phosphatase [Bacteroidota bacterium]
MIEELRRSNELLESKVQERTEEIATQNEELLQNQEEILAQRDFINKKNTELAKVNERIQANEQVLRKSLDRLKTTQKSLEHKNKVLEDQDRRINSSISAALTIQRAILPTRKELDAILKEYFVIYRPKDRVSGDFYWCQKLDGKIFIVAADCTGHGVPGAFMTLIVSALLDKIVRSYRVLDPALVLSQLHSEIQAILKQKENKNNNGLDAVIINIEEQPNDQYRLIVAAAKQSMYYIPADTEELHVFKGDRKAIGGIQNESIQF